MSDLTAIREAIGNTIKTFADMEIEAHNVVETVAAFPAVVVEPEEGNFELAMNQGADLYFNVFALCSAADMESGQNQLDQLCSPRGPNSIREIIFNHDDLGLPDCQAFVTAMRGYAGTYESGTIKAVGAILRVRVVTD